MSIEGSPTPKTAITGRKLEPSLSKSVQEIDCNKHCDKSINAGLVSTCGWKPNWPQVWVSGRWRGPNEKRKQARRRTSTET